MSDFEQIRALRGQKLANRKEHVFDVLALNLTPEDEYQAGELALASYEFVPWALTGLAAAQQTPTTGARATTRVTLPLSDDQGGTDSAARDVTLYGPGDVLGEPGQIVRRYPPPDSTNAEETFHPHIEFDRPELPWAFSAHTPEPRMPAWLALVVFARDEVGWESPAGSGLPPIVSAPLALLPPLAQAWAWAHAQAPGGSASLEARLSTAYGPLNVSRLLAARVLTQETDYVACLVPTTDAGRRAGLGEAGKGTLGPAWPSGSDPVRLPVYDRWTFRTAPDGDFARLAKRLVAVDAPWQIGRRTLYAGRPGKPLDELGADEPGRHQVIRCALYSPAEPPPDAPSDTAAWSEDRTKELKQALERPAVIEGSGDVDPGEAPDLPIVGPRIYAKSQRGSATIAAGDWFAELNLKPTNRVAAGLGTRIVQKDQEELMQAAWAQVGEVEKANRELALAELARHLATSVHERLGKVDAGRLLQMTRPLAPRVRLDGAQLTLAGQTARSATPAAALSGSFRRAVRAAGPVARRLEQGQREALAGITAVAGVPRDFTRPYVELDGIGGLSQATIDSLDPAAVSRALGVPPEQALGRVTEAASRLKGGRSLATAVGTPEAWGKPDTSFVPGNAVAERISVRIRERIPENPHEDVVGARWLGSLATAIGETGVPGSEGMHRVGVELGSAVTEIAGPGATVVTRGGTTTGAPVGGVDLASHILSSGLLSGLSSHAHSIQIQSSAFALAPARGLLSERAAGELLGSIIRPGGTELLAEEGGVAVEEAPLQLQSSQATLLATWLQDAATVTVDDLRGELASLIADPGVLSLSPTPPREELAVRREDLLGRLDPQRTVIGTTRARLGLGELPFDPFAEGAIRPIMAEPRFDRAMYKALDSYDREWLLPGLGELPEPEMVTLLASNDAFVEALLVGLSDEMARELLWRNYPTNQRGTYFHRFWDEDEDELIEEIHRFRSTPLGRHMSQGPPDQSGRAVVVIRGEIVRRYEDLTVMALRDHGRDDHGRPLLPEAPDDSSEAARILFKKTLPPDLKLVGFDVTVDALRSPGWWIVLAEHPQAPRFRRSEADLAGAEVVFASAPSGQGATGATVARERIENPTRVAFAAAEFLPPLGP
jgi:hypothetical protein